MSQSHRPTRAPVCSSATARFAATVDLPTPPLPLATAIMCLTPGIRVVTVAAPAPPGGAWISIKTLALRMPSIVRKAPSASFLIVAGMFGSFVASASCTLTSPLSIWIDFTNPNEMMSRVKPGYFTDFNAFFTCSSEIDIFQGNRPASDVNRREGGSSCPQDDGIAQGQPFNALVAQKIPGGRAAVSKALRTTRSTCLPLPVINVNWMAPTFEEDRCVYAFDRLQRRAPNNSTARVTCLRTRKLFLFPWDRRWVLPGWFHQTRHSRLCFPRREIHP